MVWSLCVFFKQRTAYVLRISDWSSDVCSSDLWVCQVHRADPCHRGPERRLAYRPSYLSSTGSIQEERGGPVADPPAQKLLPANRTSPISAGCSQRGRVKPLDLSRRSGKCCGMSVAQFHASLRSDRKSVV